jgi:uncharacterized protein (TIGR03086 family)
MNVIALHDRALDALGTTIEKIDVAQLGDPTPCSEFDVRALLNHVIGGNLRFVAIAQGEPGASVPATGDFVTDDPVMPYRESAAALSKAWSDPAVLERTVQMPFGDFPGEFALGIHIVETVVHTWDLSKATGQPTELDPELCEAAWERTKDIDDSFRGPGRPFGQPVAAPPDATPTERLVAWLGRQP